LNIDLPLILTLIVGVSGAIWMVDGLLFARARAARLEQLQNQYPGWQDSGSSDAKRLPPLRLEQRPTPLL